MQNNNNIPELLAPAGNFEKLQTALLYGANAVYLGGTEHNLRMSTQGFDGLVLNQAVDLAHKQNAKIFFCLNSIPYEPELATSPKLIEHAASCGVDAFIIADPGLLRMAKKYAPDVDIHLSTQANTTNSEAIAFWHDLGVTRVNIAREVSLPQLRALCASVKKQCPGMELELFVHGAMCLAVSGQCLLSTWLNNRPANLGKCTHPCRFEYKPLAVAVEDKQRPGAVVWEATEEEVHSKFWAPNDLCLIKYLKLIKKLGIDSIKVEGRMKGVGYVAQTISTYRHALDVLAGKHKPINPAVYLEELQNTATRPLSTGFFLPNRKILAPYIEEKDKKTILAQVKEQQIAENTTDEYSTAEWMLSVRARWENDKTVEFLMPDFSRIKLTPEQYSFKQPNGVETDKLNSGTDGILCFTPPVTFETKQLQQGVLIRLIK